MKIDLHIHTKDCSDGSLCIEDIFKEAKARDIGMLSITDHDSVDCQARAVELAETHGIRYVTGVELSLRFAAPGYRGGREAGLDLLCYGFDPTNFAIKETLDELAKYREHRARKIIEIINVEFEKDGVRAFNEEDLENIKDSADGSLGRPHIADYMIRKGVVRTRNEAFDKYLERCNIPKFPLHLDEVARLIDKAGGVMVLAHPNIVRGPSLRKFTTDLGEQTGIIEDNMLEYIHGIECWHTQLDKASTEHYLAFVRKHDLIATGGSDCHQDPILMGTLDIPDWVAEQKPFRI